MVGGNLTATIQIKHVFENEIGESTPVWEDLYTIKGWLDLSSGSSTRLPHKTKTEESTHVFICDYDPDVRNLDVRQCRFVCSSGNYEIKYIDDPMELHDHLEITLKYIGVTDGESGGDNLSDLLEGYY